MPDSSNGWARSSPDKSDSEQATGHDHGAKYGMELNTPARIPHMAACCNPDQRCPRGDRGNHARQQTHEQELLIRASTSSMMRDVNRLRSGLVPAISMMPARVLFPSNRRNRQGTAVPQRSARPGWKARLVPGLFAIRRIRRSRVGGALPPRVWQPIDEARRLWSSPRVEQKPFVTLLNASVTLSAPASTVARSRPQRDLHVPGRGAWPGSVSQMLPALARDASGSTPVSPLAACAPTLSQPWAAADRRRPVGPLKARWRWPAWSSARRACLRERARSPHARIRLPESTGLARCVLPGELASMWSCLA
jgi:hypothetical protein